MILITFLVQLYPVSVGSDLEFAADQKALQSILDHTGIAMTTTAAPGAAPCRGAAQRQTIAGDGVALSTPLGMRQPRLTMVM